MVDGKRQYELVRAECDQERAKDGAVFEIEGAVEFLMGQRAGEGQRDWDRGEVNDG